jgi:uncharacterized membrane protein YbhN (UPF0104 family)
MAPLRWGRGIARYLPVLLLLGLAVHLILPWLASLTDTVRVIERLSAWAVGLAVGAQILSYAGSGYLVQALAHLAGDRISVVRGTLITLGAASAGLVIGGLVGNAAASYRWARAAGVRPQGALLAAWLPTVFNSAALVALSVLGLAQLLAMGELSGVEAAGFALMLLLLLGVAGMGWWAVGHRESATTWLVRSVRWWRGLLRRPFDERATATQGARLLEAVASLRAGGWRRPAAGALANMVFDALTLYFLFVAAGYAIGLDVLLAGYGLPLLLGRLSFFLPGGVGVIEATMTVLYHGLGAPTTVVVVVILAYRALSFWIPTFLGFPIAVYLDAAGRSEGSHRPAAGRQRSGCTHPHGEWPGGLRRR